MFCPLSVRRPIAAVITFSLFSNGGNFANYLDDFITKAEAARAEGRPTFKSNPLFPIQGSSTTQKGMYIIVSFIFPS